MSSPKIYIGTPVADAKPFLNYVISLIVTIKECHALGWAEPIIYFRACDSDIARARNVILARFLKSDCTDLVLIDSDISWPPGAITRMLSHKKDFVSAAYRGKTDDKDLYFVRWPEQKEMFEDAETGHPLLKVDGTPLGFCRLTRECVEKLVAHYHPHEWMRDLIVEEESFPWVVDFEKFENNTRYEEGYTLCKKWQAIGGDCWLDPGINLGHMGVKIFESNLVGFLEKMQSVSRLNESSETQKRIEEAWLLGAPRVAAE